MWTSAIPLEDDRMTTITRAIISSAVAGKIGISRDDVDAVVQRFLKLLAASLAEGESVKLSNFGTLEVRSRAARPGRNPHNGVAYPISARQTVGFLPSAKLLRKLAQRASSSRG